MYIYIHVQIITYVNTHIYIYKVLAPCSVSGNPLDTVELHAWPQRLHVAIVSPRAAGVLLTRYLQAWLCSPGTEQAWITFAFDVALRWLGATSTSSLASSITSRSHQLHFTGPAVFLKVFQFENYIYGSEASAPSTLYLLVFLCH